MSNRPTAKQLQVLELMREHIRRTGNPPTTRELMRGLQVSSSCTVQRHLEGLERHGLVERAKKYQPRGWRVSGLLTPQEETERLRDALRQVRISISRALLAPMSTSDPAKALAQVQQHLADASEQAAQALEEPS